MQQQTTQGSTLRKDEWNNSDNSNHSQIAISTQKGDFLVEQIKNGAGGEQSTYFLSPINSKSFSTIRRGSCASIDLIGKKNFYKIILCNVYIYKLNNTYYGNREP